MVFDNNDFSTIYKFFKWAHNIIPYSKVFGDFLTA